jgi:hypothetical protein
MECEAGEEAQVDFVSGYWLGDDRKRLKVHVLRMVLSHSRKGYSEAGECQDTPPKHPRTEVKIHSLPMNSSTTQRPQSSTKTHNSLELTGTFPLNGRLTQDLGRSIYLIRRDCVVSQD